MNSKFIPWADATSVGGRNTTAAIEKILNYVVLLNVDHAERGVEQEHDLVRQITDVVGKRGDIAGRGTNTRLHQLVLFALVRGLREISEQATE